MPDNNPLGDELGENNTKETPVQETDWFPQDDFRVIERIWKGLVWIGLGETTVQVGTSVLSVFLFLVVIWFMSTFYLNTAYSATSLADQAAVLPTSTPSIDLVSMVAVSGDQPVSGITRKASLHTNAPSTPRYDVIQYTVVEGDTIFGIAEKYDLNPQTILWGNLDALGDNPHLLTPGMVLNILPVDGVYHKWSAGEGLNGVASYYGVTPEDIIDWPGNNLTEESVGDYTNPDITPGTLLVVPGGTREFSSWATPRITRDEPATARNLGPGYCGEVYTGVIGTGNFIFPTPHHYLSGYDYTPSTNHFGLDFDGDSGDPIYASDHGVVVYAGWNNFGYGNMIVLDHGNGWQTLYAHLDSLSVVCGQSVYQGTVIGAMGSTGNSSGPHLHFEMYSDEYGKVNPWNFLQ